MRRARSQKLDTIQLTGPHGDTLIFRLQGKRERKIKRLYHSPVFKKFIGDPNIRKVGASIRGDLDRIKDTFGVECDGAYDIGCILRRESSLAAVEMFTTDPVGLKTIFEKLRRDRRLKKRRQAVWNKDSRALSLGRWGGDKKLTPRQIKYAAEDSWVSWWCYQEAMRRGLVIMDQKSSDDLLVDNIIREMTSLDDTPNGRPACTRAFKACLGVVEECNFSRVSMMKAIESWNVAEIWVGNIEPQLYWFSRNDPNFFALNWSREVMDYQAMRKDGKLADFEIDSFGDGHLMPILEKCGLSGRSGISGIQPYIVDYPGDGSVSLLHKTPGWEYEDGVWDQYGRLTLVVKMSDGFVLSVSSSEKRKMPGDADDNDLINEWDTDSARRRVRLAEDVHSNNSGYDFGRKNKKELTKEEVRGRETK